MSLMVCGCKTINSRMYSESSDIVLYTRGDTTGADLPLDNDVMYQLSKVLNIQPEFFPDINGSFPSADQTKEQMLELISAVIPRLEDDSTLYWYFNGHGGSKNFSTKSQGSSKQEVDNSDKEYTTLASGKGEMNMISYETLFDHMLSEVQKNKKKIKRLVILIISCQSGSLIPIIQQNKYKDKLYRELIVFTPVEDGKDAMAYQVLPELVSSATFLKIGASTPTLKTEEIIQQVYGELRPYPSRFNQLLSLDKNCVHKIFYAEENQAKLSSLENKHCSLDIPNIELFHKKEPSWQDLINLTVWLFKTNLTVEGKQNYSSYLQTPQFYTYPENLKNEKLFQ